MNFQEFCNEAQNIDDQIVQIGNSVAISFRKPTGSAFSIDPSDIAYFLDFISENYEQCKSEIENHPTYNRSIFTQYQEKPYRALYGSVGESEKLKTIKSLGGSQTQQITRVISRFICFFAKIPFSQIDENTHFDIESIDKARVNIPENFNSFISKNTPSVISSDRKLAFQAWLKFKRKSEKTIRAYSETVINTADKLIALEGTKYVPLYEAGTYNEAQAIVNQLVENPEWMIKKTAGHGMYQAGLARYLEFLKELLTVTHLPKPFILLAGISGTGKTRIVREQAKAHKDDLSNYCLIPVRPDWHEPSDLLGYVSRIGTPRYVVTELLSFVVKAWKDAAQSATVDAIVTKPVTAMTPYWLCLDEMNLAPVEQYFADYLSVLESREWTADGYRCLPLLKAELFNKDEGIIQQLRKDLGLDDAAYTDLWNYFKTTGIPLPPNLIVAGTVNMDETTHGFSRKVIDRAFTIDFGAFFPNDFSHYFAPATINKTLSFPVLSKIEPSDLNNVTADPDGSKSIAFLNEINKVLKNTPFELAFRALNELLISLVCFQPKDDAELQAVWDDFLMTKVLPRIDGDGHKLGLDGEESLLTKLETVSKQQMPAIWDTQRPDLLRENIDQSPLLIACRSAQKLQWMQKRLADNSFTSFWP